MKRTLLLVLLLVCGAAAHAQPEPVRPPSVVSVDPPSWWVGSTVNPLQLLVRGTDLGGARLVSDSPDLAILDQKVNAAGTYLLAHARIAPSAKPGRVGLRVEGGGGSAPAAFELLAPLAREGRFQGFTPDDVVYLIMPDRFSDGDPSNDRGVDRTKTRAYHGGDIRGVVDRLPYLKALGVTVVWMTPIYDNSDAHSDYHGYHATDFYDVEEHFGTMADMKALVEAAHRLGMKVMQDQVANHTGPEHPWLATPPTPTWFNGTAEHHLDNAFDIGSLVDPSGDPDKRRATLEGWFAGKLPDLNQNDPETAQYLIQNSLWWVGQTGLDAIRQDTMPYAPRSYWSKWIEALHREYPRVTVLGEVFAYEPKMVAFFQGGVVRDGIDSHVDSLFDFPTAFALAGYVTRREDASKVAEVIEADPLYTNPMALVTFVNNHDTPRAMSMVGGDAERFRLALTILATLRGTPQLYYGDEIGMPGTEDPDNRRDFPGGFAGDPANAFTPEGRTDAEQRTFALLRSLLALRREHAALRGPATKVLAADGPVLAYSREGGGERAIVVVNAGDVPQSRVVEVQGTFADGRVLDDALSPARTVAVRGGKIAVELPARSAAILFE